MVESTSDYSNAVAALTPEQRKPMLRNLEDFFEGMRTGPLSTRIKDFEKGHPILNDLRTGEDSKWFVDFFETLVGAQLMAQSNSFRSYQNRNCLDAYVRPLVMQPLPPAAALMTLHDFMKAGPRIPDENTYTQQVRLFCGRSSINHFQGIEANKIIKIYLSLKNNKVLQKLVLSRAAGEAQLILQAYRSAL